MSRATAVAILALVVASPPRATADVAADVRAFEETFARACNAGDVSATVALYADDARLVWPGTGEEARGKDEIEKTLVHGCKEVRDLKLVMRTLDVIPLDDTHVATVGHWDDSFTGPGGRTIAVKVRTSEVLVKQGGAWKYLVDHASVGLAPPPPARGRRPVRRGERAAPGR